MTTAAFGMLLALASAVSTAATHAIWKAGKDKLAIRALIGATCAACMAPVALLVPIPNRDMLPWLVASGAIHVVYSIVLIWSYSINSFAVAYPVARGVAPVATALLAFLWLGDRVSAASMFGIALVSGGIVLIAFRRSIARSGLAASVIAGLLTTCYTLVDAQAARLAPTALTFVTWFFILEGLLIFSFFWFAKGRRGFSLLVDEGRTGIIAGLVTLVGFGSVLIALRFTPVGIVSALRETSVVFAMLIAALALREKVDWKHVLGACVIVAGATTILIGVM